MQPYAARDLLVRTFYLDGEQAFFIADPNTQRWIIGNQETRDLLQCADGLQSERQIAERLAASPGRTEELLGLLINEGLVFQDKTLFRKQCMPLVCDREILALHLEITNQCNLRCTHCYLSSGAKKKNELGLQEIMDIIDQLEPGSGKKLCITGGEPLLHPDFFNIIEYAAVTRGLEVDIYTNALLIDDETAARLQDIRDRAPFGINIQISIEGADAETNDMVRGKGVFDKVGQAVNRLINRGMEKNIVLFVCLTKDNISQFDALVTMAETLRIKALKFSQWQKQGRTYETSWADKSPTSEEWIHCGHRLLSYPHRDTILLGNFWGDLKNDSHLGFGLTGKLFPKLVCNLKVAPRIDCQGNVWSCQVFVDQASIVGNTRKTTLSQIFSDRPYKNLFRLCTERESHITECATCQWKSFCGGGCAGFAYAENENYHMRDFFCSIRTYWLEQFLTHKIEQYKLQRWSAAANF